MKKQVFKIFQVTLQCRDFRIISWEMSSTKLENFIFFPKDQWLKLNCSLQAPSRTLYLHKKDNQNAKETNKKCMVPFYGRGSTVSRLQCHCEETVYFLSTKSPGVSGTQLINLGRMKGLVNLGETQWFWTLGSFIRNPAPYPLGHCSIQFIYHTFTLTCLLSMNGNGGDIYITED